MQTGAGEWRAAFHGLAALGAATRRLSALVAQAGLEPAFPILQADASWILGHICPAESHRAPLRVSRFLRAAAYLG